MLRTPRITKNSHGRRHPALAAIVGVTILAGVGAMVGCAPSSDTSGSTGDGDGVLRVGVVGSGTSETLDPGMMTGDASIARVWQMYEPLVTMGTGDELVEYVLAESLTPNEDASVWTLKLRDGVTWHDGSPFTVDDVIYTINYNVDNVTWAINIWSNIDRPNLKKIDDLTLEIPLSTPNFLYPETLVDLNELIIKDGTTDFAEPIGTGPFKFESFTPGQEATFVRNEDYWDGAPELASVEISSISDDTARVNALSSGQVDLIAAVPSSSIAQLEGAGLTVSNEPSGSWIGIRMNTQLAPFDDPRVRQAMRLLIDREQIVSNAYGGNAKAANDVFGWFDPNFADLPDIEYDPEAARALLKEAGYENLTLTLPTTGTGPGSNEMVTLFATSAAEAGVTINVQQMPPAEFYGAPQAERQWTPSSWGARTIATQINTQMSAQSIANGQSETAWSDPEFLSAYEAAISTDDPAEQREHLIEAQERMYEEGPYIISAFYNLITAHADNVSGLKSNIRFPFGDFDFSEVTVD